MKELLIIFFLFHAGNARADTVVLERSNGSLVVVEDVVSIVVKDETATRLNVQPLDDGEECLYPVEGNGTWAIEAK